MALAALKNDGNSRPSGTIRRRLIRCVKVMFLGLLLSTAVYGCLLFGSGAKSVDISVEVIDANTGEPIPNAKVAIDTENYGLFDNAWLAFVTTADNEGKLRVKQNVGYAISTLSVHATDPEVKRYAMKHRLTYASFPLRSPAPKHATYVLSYPNRGHFRIEVQQLTDVERGEIQKRYNWFADRADTTRHILSMRGINVSR